MPEVTQIVVALPPGADAPDGTIGVAGGEHRSQSVLAALRAGEGDPVIVHDAARALVTPQIFAAALEALETHGCDAVIAAAPVTDTIKQAADGVVSATLDRSTLWAVQTPQVFRRAALERALSVADDLLAAATDDAWLVERDGGSVRIVVDARGEHEDHDAARPAGRRARAARARRLIHRRTGVLESRARC